jgi:divalent metal cation (Fe/Co/Zn/Cd) transporter
MPPVSAQQLRHRGLRVSVVSAAWTILASAAGIGIGIAHRSVALVAFGAVGFLDAAGSITLAIHFRLFSTDVDRADRVERVALRVITTGLFMVGIATAVASIARLVGSDESEHSVAGAAIAGASTCVLAVLALRKRRLALRIPSHALLADSHLSAIGAVLAAVTLTGTLADDAFGWSWADPVAALCVAVIAARLGIEIAREAR